MPDERTSTRPAAVETAYSLLRPRPRRSSAPSSASRSRTRTLTQALGQLLHRVALGQVAARERLEREQRRRDAVAGGHEAGVDDVARLLAAERPAAAEQLGQHVAVADRRGGHLDARARASPGGSRSWSSPSRPRRRRAAGRARAGAARPARSARRRRRPRRRGRRPARGRRRRRRRSPASWPSSCAGERRRRGSSRSPRLMLRPSGSTATASTSAPRRRKISGATR